MKSSSSSFGEEIKIKIKVNKRCRETERDDTGSNSGRANGGVHGAAGEGA